MDDSFPMKSINRNPSLWQLSTHGGQSDTSHCGAGVLLEHFGQLLKLPWLDAVWKGSVSWILDDQFRAEQILQSKDTTRCGKPHGVPRKLMYKWWVFHIKFYVDRRDIVSKDWPQIGCPKPHMSHWSTYQHQRPSLKILRWTIWTSSKINLSLNCHQQFNHALNCGARKILSTHRGSVDSIPVL